MPLDGISTRCLSAELDVALKDARVDRIYQTDKFDIIINMRQDRENLKLLLSANPSLPRLHLTTETRENPALPPMFCMLLRKHLQGARVLSVRTPGSERIIELRFQTQNELGDKVEKTLVAELMGRHSNIIFLNEDRRIHDAIVHVDESISRVREVMPARVYLSPPDQGKRSIEAAAAMLAQLPVSAAEASDLLPFFPPELHERGVEKALLELMAGFSPALCHEVAFQAGIDGRKPLNRLTDAEMRLLLLALQQLIRTVLTGNFRPSVFFRDAGQKIPVDFHALALSDFAFHRKMPNLSAAMDLYYTERHLQNALAQSRQALARQVNQQLEQTRKRLLIHETDLRESQQMDEYRRAGDLILSLMHEIEAGADSLTRSAAESPDGLPLEVKLDPTRSAAQNAQRYYRRYTKARARAEMSERLLNADRAEMEWLESLENAVAAAENLGDLKALRDEISEVGLRPASPFGREAETNYSDFAAGQANGKTRGKNGQETTAGVKLQEPGKPGSRKKKAAAQAKQRQIELSRASAKGKGKNKAKGKGEKSPAALPPRKYTSSDGFAILVGRNNLQNDQLTLKQARKDDIWLHVQKMPGTHVIISSGGREVPGRTLLEAAETAAYFSRAAVGGGSAAKVAVDYCPVAHVRKPAGARPGKVIYDRYQTIIVEPKDPAKLLHTPLAGEESSL